MIQILISFNFFQEALYSQIKINLYRFIFIFANWSAITDHIEFQISWKTSRLSLHSQMKKSGTRYFSYQKWFSYLRESSNQTCKKIWKDWRNSNSLDNCSTTFKMNHADAAKIINNRVWLIKNRHAGLWKLLALLTFHDFLFSLSRFFEPRGEVNRCVSMLVISVIYQKDEGESMNILKVSFGFLGNCVEFESVL